MKELLQLRKNLKAKKPDFIRQQGRNLKRINTGWRAPKGIHSKQRLKLRGKSKRPSVGYSSPKIIRGLNSTGLKPVIISNIDQLKDLSKEHGIIISKNLGQRNKISVLKKIKESNLEVLNFRDIDAFLKKLEEEKKSRHSSFHQKNGTSHMNLSVRRLRTGNRHS